MDQSNWKSSGRPQEKPKRRPKKLQEWKKAMNLLRARLKEGINNDKWPHEGLFVCR